MEEEYFEELREQFCNQSQNVQIGKMMSSEAITYNQKVFAFFSRKKKMVFKLGKEFDPDLREGDVVVFNPFTKRPPLHGWYEVPYTQKELWKPFAKKALKLIKKEK